MTAKESRNFTQSSLPFNFGLDALPSPKVKTSDRAETALWSKFLAAFSVEFGVRALAALSSRKDQLVYDPFVGSGTTLVAASKFGVNCHGNDLDPISALISRAKISRNVDKARLTKLLSVGTRKSSAGFPNEAVEFYSPSDLAFATTLYSRLKTAVQPKKGSVLRALIQDVSGRYDTETLALASLIISAKKVGNLMKGSNPVWFRKNPQPRVGTGQSLCEVARANASKMHEDLVLLHDESRQNQLSVSWADAREAVNKPGSVDCVLTSPPYLNRLDYVVHHSPEILLLSGLEAIDISTLRRSMVGTTKMVTKDGVKKAIGPLGQKILNAIREHPSKASGNYYHPFFLKYFNDIASTFQALRVQCKPGAVGLMVVQNSYYKDLLVPSHLIFQEIAIGCGFAIELLRRERVKTHLGQLSVKQMQYVPNKTLEEHLLFMQF